jgi:hypothetical protein
MKDLRVVHAKRILDVTGVAFTSKFIFPAVVANGVDLDNTTEVLYNSVGVPEFAAISPTTLIVRIPESQIGKPFVDLKALSDIPLGVDGSAELSFRVSRPQMISGAERLVQAWLLLLHTTPGSSIFAPSSGGGVRTLLGSDSGSARGAAAGLASVIDRTSQELIRLQDRTPALPLDEKLLSCELLSVNFVEETGETYAAISLQNALGQNAQILIR